MGTNRPSNRDAPRVPGEEGTGGAPWGKILAAIVGLALLAILIPLACQALGGGGDDEEGSGGAAQQEEERGNNGGDSQGGDDAQDGANEGDGGNGGGAAGEEAGGSSEGNGEGGGGTGREVSGEIAGIDRRGGDGTSVTIPAVTIDGANGWVAVRAEEGDAPGAVLGWAPVREGENTSVEVQLGEPLASTQRLYAVLHADEPADGEFAFPEGDPPLDADARADATQTFRYTLAGASGEGQEGAAHRRDELPESGGVPSAVLMAMGAALLFAGLALAARSAAVLRRENR